MRIIILAFLTLATLNHVVGQKTDVPLFTWGNGLYYTLNIGESIYFEGHEIKLLEVYNHYNCVKVGTDTLWLKVARRSVPANVEGVRIFIADNRKVKSIGKDTSTHGLLTKDALLCLSNSFLPLLDPQLFNFPVSFNDGYTWNAEEDSYPFSYYKSTERESFYLSYAGIGLNLHDARGLQKHWLVAMENSRVVWIADLAGSQGMEQRCVLLESESNPGIYYAYNGLYSKNITVKIGQHLKRGDAIGTAWGGEFWGHVQLVVMHSEKEPVPNEGFYNVVNGFPQLFHLYHQNEVIYSRSYSRGRIVFGIPRSHSGNQLNIHEFESYSGKGWITGRWNPADKVEWIGAGVNGNARLKKVLFEGTAAQAKNPCNYFEYKIVVPNGTYRIRARVGDLYLPTWQEINFENVGAGVKSLEGGDFNWTGERIVQVNDGSLDIRIYIDPDNRKIAGLSEIVFQRIN